MGMLTQLKNTFSRSRMSMSTSAPLLKTKILAKPKTVAKSKTKIAVTKVKTKSSPLVASLTPIKKSERITAKGEQCFWSHDGKILATHDDLKKALEVMSAPSYKHHTTGRNDFANWVELVLEDKACASELRKAKNQKASVAALVKKLS